MPDIKFTIICKADKNKFLSIHKFWYKILKNTQTSDMKKYVVVLLLLYSIAGYSQNEKGGYMSLRGGISMKNGSNKGTGRVSVGVSNNNIFGIGGGFGVIQFEKPYLPLTFDLSFFGKPGKISPCVIGSAGYGIYNYNTTGLTMRGGFTGGMSAGIAFPAKGKFKTFIVGGASVYSFTSYFQNKTIGSSETRLEITTGFKF